MSTGNYELGAFDRAIQRATTTPPAPSSKTIQELMAITAYHWLVAL